MTEDKNKKPKGNSARKKPSSCSHLLRSRVITTICCCIAKTPCLCASSSKKLSKKNISDADMEYVRITNTVGCTGHGVPSCGQHGRNI
eukprot:scaffold159366_cov61-Attheya_sp.AAC.2